MFYATMPTGRHEVVGLNDHEGLWSKKEEFWRNKQNGEFPGKCFKKRLLTFLTKMYFRENVLKRELLPRQIYGKSSKSLLFFFNKDIEISKQSFIKQKSILLFSTRI